MNHPPRSMPAPRRTTLVAFLVLLLAVMTLTVFMVSLNLSESLLLDSRVLRDQ